MELIDKETSHQKVRFVTDKNTQISVGTKLQSLSNRYTYSTRLKDKHDSSFTFKSYQKPIIAYKDQVEKLNYSSLENNSSDVGYRHDPNPKLKVNIGKKEEKKLPPLMLSETFKKVLSFDTNQTIGVQKADFNILPTQLTMEKRRSRTRPKDRMIDKHLRKDDNYEEKIHCQNSNAILVAEQMAQAHEQQKHLYNQFLLFIPNEKRALSVDTGHHKSFYSFREMAEKTNNLCQAKQQGYYEFSSKKVSNDKHAITILKDFLKFNKYQQKGYIDDSETERETKIALYARSQRSNKMRNKMFLRVIPSAPTNNFKQHQESNNNQNDARFLFYETTVKRNRPDWRPDSREGHTFSLIGRQIILYGGISTYTIQDIAVFDIGKIEKILSCLNSKITFDICLLLASAPLI